MAHHHGRHGGSSGASGSEVHGSENYVWNTSSYLGRGATAVVYKGVHKETGEPAAIKTFTTDGFHRPPDALMKELQILQTISHENVVKLLAIEEEIPKRNKVVIMELCAGGSLYHILDDPENSCGLCEKEFLLVLEHLTAGMKYLRGNIISHRDLKPGNIVKFIKEDGSHIYKLTDFGAAKAIKDDEQFTSLCGTEEYLNPDIYDKAVMKLPDSKTFLPSADLWSMGATIYHVATGSLPFRPHRGRDNRAGMHFMLRNKASGVISAVQHDDGTIEWSKELPKTCLLSVGLRRLITPLIAGLLESRQEKVYTFNQFFQEVADIIACKPFHLFNGQNCTKVTLYTKPTDEMIDLQHDIAATTGIAIEDQLLFTYNNHKLDTKCGLKIHELKDLTDENKPVLLLSRSSTEIGITKSSEQAGISTWSHPPISKFPIFDMKLVNLDHDAFKGKSFTSSAYTVKRHIVYMLKCYNHLTELPRALSFMIEEELRLLIQTATNIIQSFSKTDDLLKLLARHYSIFKEITETCSNSNTESLQQLGSILNDKKQERETVSVVLKTLQMRASNLEQKFLLQQKGQLYKQWESQLSENIGIDQLNGCENTAATYVKDIRDAWKALAKFREMRRLAFHDEQFHQLEKIKLKRTGDKLMTLWQKASTNLRQANKELNKWYSLANVGLVQVSCLSNEIRQVQKTILEYEHSITKGEEECGELLLEALSIIKSSSKKCSLISDKDKTPVSSILPTHPVGEFVLDKSNSIIQIETKNGMRGDDSEPRKSKSSSLLKELQEVKASAGSLWSVVQENNSMMERVQSFVAQLNNNDIDRLVGNLSLNQEGN